VETTRKPSQTSFHGLVTLLFGATIVFSELQDALNMSWKIPYKPERGMVIGLIRDRFLSVVMVFGIGVLLLISMLANTALTAIVHIFGANFLLRSQLYQGVCGQKGSENAHRRGQ
jgi:membrane protein